MSATCATSQNWQSFTFVFENGHTFSGDNCPGSEYAADQDGNSQNAFLPKTGGATSVLDGPGMTLHTSCSEVYEDGWGVPHPDATADPAWKLASFHIEKFHNDDAEPHQVCDQPWEPPTTTTSTTLEETTSTTLEETTSTTSEEPTTTTVQAPTTTIEVLGTSITAAPTTTVAVEVTEGTLPFTGFENGTTGLFAMLLVGIGLVALAGARRFGEDDS